MLTKHSLLALHENFDALHKENALKTMRETAWKHCLHASFPGKQDQGWHYFPFHQFYEIAPSASSKSSFVPSLEELLSHVQPECRESYFFFLDGAFIPELSNFKSISHDVVALPLTSAMNTYGSFIENRWNKMFKEDKDFLSLLNQALHPEGLFFYLPPNTTLKVPVQTLSLSTNPNIPSFTRILLFLAERSQINWISSGWGSGIRHLFVDISLEEGASSSHTSLSDSEEGWTFNSLRTTLKRDAYFQYFAACFAPAILRQNIKTILLGERSQAILQGIWNLRQQAQAHLYVDVEHLSPSAKSLQKFKGVLSGFSQSSFEGRIYVHPQAQKTEAFQLNQNLLLVETGAPRAYARPSLEIFTDDVKASHGATVAQLDEEELFYLKSRAISLETSKRLLIQGFLREIIDSLPLPSIQRLAQQYAFQSF